MNFRRIEIIFFFAFLGVNIFLFSIFHEARDEQNNIAHSNQKVPIEKRLMTDDIQYHGDVSKEKLTGYYLSANQTDFNAVLKEVRDQQADAKAFEHATIFDSQTLQMPVDDDVYISDRQQAEKTAMAFVTKNDKVLYGQDFHYMAPLSDVDNKEQPRIVLAQMYESLPINDTTSRMELSLQQRDGLLVVTEYKERHLSNLTPLREKMSLYSEEEVLETLYTNNKLPAGSKILWTQLAYTMILQVRDKNVYVPAWFVAVETNDRVFQVETVNAFSNRIITNNVVQKVENS